MEMTVTHANQFFLASVMETLNSTVPRQLAGRKKQRKGKKKGENEKKGENKKKEEDATTMETEIIQHDLLLKEPLLKDDPEYNSTDEMMKGTDDIVETTMTKREKSVMETEIIQHDLLCKKLPLLSKEDLGYSTDETTDVIREEDDEKDNGTDVG